jgi:outer membrane autotransporter protein
MRGSYYNQESYTEEATTAVPRDVDAYDRFSLQSILGFKTAMYQEYRTFIMIPEVRANWLHEFNTDNDRIGYSLVGGSGDYTFGIQSPEENLFEIGTSVSARLEDKAERVLELSLSLDGRFGGDYSAIALSARALYEF